MIPRDAKILNHKILREGEATGHAHRATASDVMLAIHGDQLYMRAPSGTEVVHEEHAPVLVPAGDKCVGGVREMDHFAEEARDVVD